MELIILQNLIASKGFIWHSIIGVHRGQCEGERCVRKCPWCCDKPAGLMCKSALVYDGDCCCHLSPEFEFVTDE